MNNDQPEDSNREPIRQFRRSSEEIVRELEQFPVEVLQAALHVLQLRQQPPDN